MKFLLQILLSVLLLSCTNSHDAGGIESTSTEESEIKPIHYIELMVIGGESSSLDNTLGFPVGVRTDQNGLIYIADKGLMNIKVYDQNGNYSHSLGGRGRGPGEFHDIELMEITPDENLVFMDRSNLRYMILSLKGEEITTFPYNLEDQFYPQAITYSSSGLLSLFFDSSTSHKTPIEERHLFHSYSSDFQSRKISFLPISDIVEEDDGFPIFAMSFHPGSFVLSKDQNTLFYSPTVYRGKIFTFSKSADNQWVYTKMLSGFSPDSDPYLLYNSERQYNRALENGVSRAITLHRAGETFWGSLLSMDAGIYMLDNNHLIQFYATWREDFAKKYGETVQKMDLYAQIFNPDGELIHHDFLFSFVDEFDLPLRSAVNWMDKNESFYLFDFANDTPVVKKFRLEF